MNYDPFVLPFSIGMVLLFAMLFYRYFSWIFRFERSDRKKVAKGIFSIKLFKAIKETFLESLLHRKVFKINPLLGYMHMSIAFGWFLLIVGGTVESKIHSHQAFNMPYEPIFFKFFNHDISMYAWANEFKFIMDFLLLFVLIGITLALTKRINSILFGMKKTTVYKPFDKLALYTLWFIFPLRYLAESFTAGTYHNGGFLTNNSGQFFAYFLPVEMLSYPTWWAYSLVLGLFFISLPFSRYMHIPTEIVLIFCRNFGIVSKKELSAFSEIEINSCPRCGICISKCKLSKTIGVTHTQAIYFLQSLRNKESEEIPTFDCLLCGRCMEVCPVGIDINNIRIAQRRTYFPVNGHSLGYLIPQPTIDCEVAYFAGCMSHLTPGITRSMESIFKEAGIRYSFIDKEGSICCGRPSMITGDFSRAEELIEKNKSLILSSKAKTLVTSCPICYKIFNEEYDLGIEVLHHSEYLLRLAESGKISMQKEDITAIYHDPCELGRGSGIYEKPRKVLSKALNLQNPNYDKNKTLCCGGSLGSLILGQESRNLITAHELSHLCESKPDMIVTSCPLCKKTFQGKTGIPVKDIAEVVAANQKKAKVTNNSKAIPAEI
jgi:Fe-S oxidoreductase